MSKQFLHFLIKIKIFKMKRQSKQNRVHYHEHYHYHYYNNPIQNNAPYNTHKSISSMRLKSAQAKPFYKEQLTWKDHLNPEVSRIYQEISQTQSRRLAYQEHKDSFSQYKDDHSTLLCTLEPKRSRFSRDQVNNKKSVYQSQLNVQSRNNSFIPTTKSMINIQSKTKPTGLESKIGKVQSLIIKKTHSIISDKLTKQENLTTTKNSDSIYQLDCVTSSIQQQRMFKNEPKHQTQRYNLEESDFSHFKGQQSIKNHNSQQNSQSSDQQSWSSYRYKLARQQSTYLRNRFIQQMQRNRPKRCDNINLY